MPTAMQADGTHRDSCTSSWQGGLSCTAASAWRRSHLGLGRGSACRAVVGSATTVLASSVGGCERVKWLLPAVLAATALLLLCLLLAVRLLQRLLRHIGPVDCGPLRPTGDGTVQQLQPWQALCSASWQQAGVAGASAMQPSSMPHLCPHFSSRCCLHDLTAMSQQVQRYLLHSTAAPCPLSSAVPTSTFLMPQALTDSPAL
jgi:hypothetical protein